MVRFSKVEYVSSRDAQRSSRRVKYFVSSFKMLPFSVFFSNALCAKASTERSSKNYDSSANIALPTKGSSISAKI